MTDSHGEVMGEEVGSKVASDEHGRTGLGGGGVGGASKKSGGRVQETVCDKDGEEGRRGDVKKPPTATKVGREKAAGPARASAKSLKRFFCFLLRRLL